MQIKSAFFLLIAAVFLISGCAVTSQRLFAPELLIPEGIKADTASVTRGDIERVTQHKGIVRVRSDKLSYGNTTLRFGEFKCLTGQRVVEGQVLAVLDIEYIEDQIKAQRDSIERMKESNAIDNELSEIDIAILQIELSELIGRAASYSEYDMEAAEAKKLEIERRWLQLDQARERQELTLHYALLQLDELVERTAAAELRAPYDGVITWTAQIFPGNWVAPFQGLVYISDEKDVFVEYSSVAQLLMNRDAVIRGNIGESKYEMERIILTTQEIAFFSNLRLPPPSRFRVLNPDENLKPGAYVNFYVYSDIAENVLRVPANTVYSDADIGSYVYVLENGMKAMRQVEVGMRTDVFVEIKNGLAEGDELFVK
ncbi:MAG: hypothetical protein FWF03_01160 [Defluviitaleaceae bacterium]|nr:hypothetical protein [Defluviitaleaceae bacterium]